jgi:hypothetical protein
MRMEDSLALLLLLAMAWALSLPVPSSPPLLSLRSQPVMSPPSPLLRLLLRLGRKL